MQNDRPQPPEAYRYLASRSSRCRMLRGADAIKPIRANSFALAGGRHFMLSGHVAFPKQNSRVLAGATEILAQRGEELTFVEPGNPANGDFR